MLGNIKDELDTRDYKYSDIIEKKPLPIKFSIRTNEKFPFVKHQKHINSCTAHCTADAVEWEGIKQYGSYFKPSRLFIYYAGRELTFGKITDNGLTIRNAFKAINTIGFCGEDLWKYDTGKVNTKPSIAAYNDASDTKLIEYRSVAQELDEIKTCLINGNPVCFGVRVYSKFKNLGKTGIVETPKESDASFIGAHAMLITGYDDSTKRFEVKNSWGGPGGWWIFKSNGWGDKGYCYMEYDYLLNEYMAYDFWMATKVST